MFGLTQSPSILEGTLDVHFDNCEQEFREVVEKAKDNKYVNDLVTGRESINDVKKLNSDSIILFRHGGLSFKLHKWHSNETILETKDPCNTTELNFAKQQLGIKAKETNILGMLWDKQSDSYIIQIPNFSKRQFQETYCKHWLRYMTH